MSNKLDSTCAAPPLGDGDALHSLVDARGAHGEQHRRLAPLAHQHDRPRQLVRRRRGRHLQRPLPVL
jgi:hypothetical protein